MGEKLSRDSHEAQVTAEPQTEKIQEKAKQTPTYTNMLKLGPPQCLGIKLGSPILSPIWRYSPGNTSL